MDQCLGSVSVSECVVDSAKTMHVRCAEHAKCQAYYRYPRALASRQAEQQEETG